MHLPEPTEETLDPQGPEGWAGLRELGQRAVGDLLHYLQTVRERPVWQPLPAEV